MKADKGMVSRSDAAAMMEEYLAKGGKITKCAPGPSENVVYKNAYRKRPRPPQAADAATPGAASAAMPDGAPQQQAKAEGGG